MVQFASKKKEIPTPSRLKEIHLTRLAAARILHISRAEFVRREGRGTLGLTPVGKNTNGYWLYRESEVIALSRTNEYAHRRALRGNIEVETPRAHASRKYDAQTAHTVFKALEEGKALKQVVIEFGIHPEEVKAVYAEWLALSDLFSIDSAALALIQSLPLSGEPVTDSASLLAAMQETFDVAPDACTSCHKRTARLCQTCSGVRIAKPRATDVVGTVPVSTPG